MRFEQVQRKIFFFSSLLARARAREVFLIVSQSVSLARLLSILLGTTGRRMILPPTAIAAFRGARKIHRRGNPARATLAQTTESREENRVCLAAKFKSPVRSSLHFFPLPDTPGDPGKRLPYQDFLPITPPQ